MISSSGNFLPLQSSISPRNQDQFWWFLILWNRFEVIFHNISFSQISTIDLLSDLINFEENIKNFLISLWIRPLFTIIHLNSNHFHQIGKFGLCFDTRLCEIDDLAVSSRHSPSIAPLSTSSSSPPRCPSTPVSSPSPPPRFSCTTTPSIVPHRLLDFGECLNQSTPQVVLPDSLPCMSQE